jgi:hypothetical protein
MTNIQYPISNKKQLPRHLTFDIRHLILDIPRRNGAGFTMVEFLVIMGIASLLFLLMSMNFLDARTGTSLTTTGDSLLSDLKIQQTKAMIGDTEGRGIPDAYGIYFKPASYVLFHGTTYLPAATDNFEVNAAEGVTLSTTFPGGSVVFATISGELVNFSSGFDSITIKDANTTRQKVIQLNKLGTATSFN